MKHYTYASSNADTIRVPIGGTGAVMWVPRDPQNSEYARVLAEVEAGEAVLTADNPTPPVSAQIRYSKVQLFAAMTDAEYATFEQVQQLQPARERAIFSSATEINGADPLFPKFEQLMRAAYPTRADILLAAARIV
jgi:hypothetical protein